MTRIDFYILDSAEPEAEVLLALRLAEKAFRAGSHVYLHTSGEEMTHQLSERIWAFRPDVFLPAGIHSETHPSVDPISIGHTEPPDSHHDILINLTNNIAPAFSRFERVLELVPAHHEARSKSRQNFSWYRDHGYPLQTHNIPSHQLV